MSFPRRRESTPWKREYLNNKGFGLVEVLIAAGIFSVILLGLLKTMDVSLLSANLGKSLIADQDLKIALSKTLETGFQCEKNLDPTNLTQVSGTDTYTLTSLKRYRDASDTVGTELIGINTFKDCLGIVRMELIEPDADSTPNTDKHREFTVYYTRKKVKHLSTRDNQACTNADTSGCYVQTCNLEYDSSDPDNITCDLLNCGSVTTKKANPLDGILLATACDRYYGFDVGNSKCVYTGPCTQAQMNKYRYLFLRENREYFFHIGRKWSNFVSAGMYAGPHMLSAVGIPSVNMTNIFGPVFGRRADVREYSSSNNFSITCSSEFPYSNTAKKCVNDSNGECDKIPYRYRCNEYSGWDVGNSECVYTGPCYENTVYNHNTSMFVRYFHLRGTPGKGLVLKRGATVFSSFVEESNTQDGFTFSCSSFSSQLPYSDTAKKCVNDSNGECDKIPYRYRCDRHYGWDVGNSECVYTGLCFFGDKSSSLRREFYLTERHIEYSDDASAATFVESFPSSSTCSSLLPYSNTVKKCVNDSNQECVKYLFKM